MCRTGIGPFGGGFIGKARGGAGAALGLVNIFV